ncbi:MAG: hypothetical protein L0Z62_49165, partial [Gemmataceae bacterium]|nr:hypothetical protein [Gemmataceae bacterium]
MEPYLGSVHRQPTTHHSPLTTHHFWAVLLAGVLLAGSVRAASPSWEVLRLVPEEVGLCLVVQDLRSHAAA